MMSMSTEITIPKYSLKQASLQGSAMFDIMELAGVVEQQPEIFLTPHRKDYYMLVLVKHGSSRHWVDMVPVTTKPNRFYFTIPQQVHVKEEPKPMGRTMLCFSEEFLSIDENQSLRNLPVLLNLQNAHEIELNPGQVDFIDDLLNKMLEEYQLKQGWGNSMLLGYLRVLLIYLSRMYIEQFGNEMPAERLLLKKFRSLVNEGFTRVHDVSRYAEQINVSAGYLGEIVKQQSGKTAIEIIHERILLEAQRQLFHTENSIKEIAYALGFEDASYFNRFFKRLVQQTPLSYRNNTRKMYH